MPFIEVGKELDQNLEDKPVPEGSYDLRIMRVDLEPSKKNPQNKNLRVMLKILGGDNADASLIFHYMGVPGSDDEHRRMKLQMMKRFFVTAGIFWDDDGAINTDDWVGKEFRCNLRQSVFEGNTRNELDLPRVSADTAPQKTGVSGRRRGAA